MADETQLALDDFLKNRALGNVPKGDDEYSDDDLRFVPQQNDPLADTFRGIVRGPVEAMKNATVNISDMLGIEGTEEEISPFFTGVLSFAIQIVP